MTTNRIDITIAQRDLRALVAHVRPAADPKSAAAMLSMVLLTFDPTKKRLAAKTTDLFRVASGAVPAAPSDLLKPAGGGSVCVSMADLAERVERLPDGPVRFYVTDNNRVHVDATSIDRKYELPGALSDEFPPTIEPGDKKGALSSFKIDASTLINIMTPTLPAVSTDFTRPHVASLFWSAAGGVLTAASTDGHRLHLAEINVEASITLRDGLMSRPAAVDVLHFLEKYIATSKKGGEGAAAPITVIDRPAWTSFLTDDRGYSFKKVDAQFPPFSQVIPTEASAKVVVDRVALDEALRAISPVLDDRSGGVKLRFQQGQLLLTAEHADRGKASERIAVEYDRGERTIGANVKYMREALAAFEEGSVAMHFSNELDPLMITPADAKLGGNPPRRICVIMPMRL